MHIFCNILILSFYLFYSSYTNDLFAHHAFRVRSPVKLAFDLTFFCQRNSILYLLTFARCTLRTYIV
uniref:Putative secreted protein n=1 Tax=Anopheles triannulatus TaxID=58253 RepID=A0A2M4B170_9DIPT